MKKQSVKLELNKVTVSALSTGNQLVKGGNPTIVATHGNDCYPETLATCPPESL